MNSSVDVSVAICTWNRAKLLDRTLVRMRELRIPDGLAWELLVVNNNGTDDTDAVALRHTGRLPVRLLQEPRQGHSHARNCAIEAARGRLILWTDDDVLVDPHWLSEYVKAAEAFPDAGFFGGTVDPWFETEPPAWVRNNLGRLESPFALRRFGPEVRPLAPGEMVFGASMAFRTPLLKENRFNTALGRVGTGMLSGDETELTGRLTAQGHHGIWVGTARVEHFIPAERMTTGYIGKFYRGIGRTSQRVSPYDGSGAQLFGAPRWLWRRYAAERLRAWRLAFRKNDAWLAAHIRAATTRGIIEELATTARSDRGEKTGREDKLGNGSL